MGRVAVSAKIENVYDLHDVEKGRLRPEQVRSVIVDDALVDTGATYLSLPRSMIKLLGLSAYRTRRARTAAGTTDFNIYGLVQLTVQGRECRVEVAELPDDCPVLIGQFPLELLDFLVDPAKQCLVGNPAHGGEQMFDMF